MTSILVVEDDPTIALGLREALTSMGYAVSDVASSGRAALDSIEQTKPDVLLMDIRLRGDLDGIETARRAMASHDVAVVFLTWHSDEATLSRAKATKPHGYLLKPFSDRDLRTTIEVAVARFQGSRTPLRSNQPHCLEASKGSLAEAMRTMSELRLELEREEATEESLRLRARIDDATDAVRCAREEVEAAAAAVR